MTKLQRMLTSFVAVIPAAFLIYLLVMAMLSYSENLSTMAYLVMAGTLVAMLITVAIPVMIMMGGKSKPAPVAVATARHKQESGEEIEALDDDGEVSSASSGSSDAHDVLDEASSEFDIGDSDQDMLGGDSEAEIETEPVEDMDDFDIEEVEEEEEEAPKSKKKKR